MIEQQKKDENLTDDQLALLYIEACKDNLSD